MRSSSKLSLRPQIKSQVKKFDYSPARNSDQKRSYRKNTHDQQKKGLTPHTYYKGHIFEKHYSMFRLLIQFVNFFKKKRFVQKLYILNPMQRVHAMMHSRIVSVRQKGSVRVQPFFHTLAVALVAGKYFFASDDDREKMPKNLAYPKPTVAGAYSHQKRENIEKNNKQYYYNKYIQYRFQICQFYVKNHNMFVYCLCKQPINRP